ncbi:MAG: sigma-70 family RNA polymerase sigma factor [Ilumatobacteraceae bacterium]
MSDPDHHHDDEWLADALERFARDRTDDALRDEIFRRGHRFAVRGARRFADRGEPLDDLVQVAGIGLLKAIERFEPSMGVPFGSYATPTILGELRRHFRDHTWSVRVPRRAKDLRTNVNAAVDELSLARPVAHRRRDRCTARSRCRLGARGAGGQQRLPIAATRSHRRRPERGPPGDHRRRRRSCRRPRDDHRAPRSAATAERTILYLRYYEELSQSQIAARAGTSQVHVGRLIAPSLELLRAT